MPSIRITPVTKEIYHVYNRGVEKRNVFCEKLDYIRFIHDLFEFNDRQAAPDFDRRYKPYKFHTSNVGGETPHISDENRLGVVRTRLREPVVEILAFCLMDNHYHLLIKQIVDSGIPLFMKKVNAGYTCAFNAKNERVGPLFQGVYKLKHVGKDEYLRHLVCYIHLNPLKFLKKLDRNGKIDFEQMWEALGRYRWSSHLDYLGEDNFGSVIEKKFILDLFGSVSDYKEFVRDWIEHENEKLDAVVPFAIDLE